MPPMPDNGIRAPSPAAREVGKEGGDGWQHIPVSAANLGIVRTRGHAALSFFNFLV